MKKHKRILLRIFEYLFKFILKKIIFLLRIDILLNELVRLGNEQDGGYVFYKGEKDYKHLISFGIAEDISFEQDFNKLYPGAKISAFDPSVDHLPQPIENTQFFKKGISKEDSENYLTLESICEKLKIDVTNECVIKMDIEGFEWEVFEKSINLISKCNILIVEFHFYERPKKPIFLFPFTLLKRYQILKKLNTQFYFYNINANNAPGYIKYKDFIFPKCIEISMLNRKSRKLNHLNMPNHPNIKNIQHFWY